MNIFRIVPNLIPGFVIAAVAVGILAPVKTLHAMDIRKVVSDKGIVAWFVPDTSVPLVAMSFAFRNAGSATDPDGKEGLAAMSSALLDEGAGELKSQAFQRALEEIAAQMSFSAGRDTFTGALRTLTAERAKAFDLLRLALNAPVLMTSRSREFSRRCLRRCASSQKTREKFPAAYGQKRCFRDTPIQNRPAGLRKPSQH